jgi:anti-anti-sigma regulatory factor
MDAWFAHRPVRDLRPGDLAWLAFANEEEQDHVIGPFVRAGLAGADTVIYVGAAEPWQLPGLRGVDLPRHELLRHVEEGRLRLIPWPDAALTEGHFDADRMLATLNAEIIRAAGEGARGVRVTAEMSWAVRDVGVKRILECERRFANAVSASTMVTAICQVDRRNVTQAELDELRGAHEVIVRPDPEFEDPVLRITRTFQPRGLSLEGELDAARHAVFAEALTSVTPLTISDEIHLDCGELDFIDLGALHLLAAYAGHRSGQASLVLDRVPRHVRTIIELVGWTRLPGVRLGDAPL